MGIFDDLMSQPTAAPVEPMTREGAIGSLRDACRRWNSLTQFRPGDLVQYAAGTISEATVVRANPTGIFVVLEVVENVDTEKDGRRLDHRLGFYDADNDFSVITMDARLLELIQEDAT